MFDDVTGLSAEEKKEFLSYTANHFGDFTGLSAENPDFLNPWNGIVMYAGIFGDAEAFNTKVCPKRPVSFRSPDAVSISIEDSFAGRIPVIRVRDEADFEDVVTNVAYKGVRPENIEKTGASFVFGKTTRYIILSAKPYSNVPAFELDLDETEWAERSMNLRFGHECTHYFTKQAYGIANNNLHDEIMADFIGMYEAFGFYRAQWFLRFMGLIGSRQGRLVFYTKDLSENVREAVSGLLVKAAEGLERWSLTEEFSAMTVEGRIRHMCSLGLSGMTEL